MKTLQDASGGYLLQVSKTFIRPDGGFKAYRSERGYIIRRDLTTAENPVTVTQQYAEMRVWDTEDECIGYAVTYGPALVKAGTVDTVMVYDEDLFLVFTASY